MFVCVCVVRFAVLRQLSNRINEIYCNSLHKSNHGHEHEHTKDIHTLFVYVSRAILVHVNVIFDCCESKEIHGREIDCRIAYHDFSIRLEAMSSI